MPAKPGIRALAAIRGTNYGCNALGDRDHPQGKTVTVDNPQTVLDLAATPQGLLVKVILVEAGQVSAHPGGPAGLPLDEVSGLEVERTGCSHRDGPRLVSLMDGHCCIRGNLKHNSVNAKYRNASVPKGTGHSLLFGKRGI